MSAITYRLGLHSLDSAAANYRFRNGDEYLAVSMSPDRFAEMGRPGWIEVAVTPTGASAGLLPEMACDGCGDRLPSDHACVSPDGKHTPRRLPA